MKFILPAILPLAAFGAVNPMRRYVVQKPVEYFSNNRPLNSVVYANGEALPTQTRPWSDWSSYRYPSNYQGINQYTGYGNSVWNGWRDKIVEEAVEEAVAEEVEEAVEEAIEDAVVAEEVEEEVYRPWSNYNNGNWPSNWYKNTDRKYYNNYQPYLNRDYRYNAYQQYRPIREYVRPATTEYVKPVAAETVKVENWKNWQPSRYSLDSSAKLTKWNGRFNWMNYNEKPVKQNSYGKWLNKNWANIQKGYNGNWYKPSTYNYDSDKTRDAILAYALLKDDN